MDKTTEKETWENGLPKYIVKDIDAWIKSYREDSSLWDCYYCELLGSLNSALNDFEITDEVHTYLRNKYLEQRRM